MTQKSVIQTLLALFVWLFFENFNVIPDSERFSTPVEIFQSYKIRKVVLDAGHGGKDPGCIGVNKTQEKNNTLAIVLAVGQRIKEAFPDIEVIYTRSTDVFVELKERAAIANRNNADLFISVHCNAMSVPATNGAETYVMGLHTAAHNLEVAKRENASIFLEEDYKKNYEGYDPNSPEAHILGSVWQGFYLEQSILLAQQVQHYAHTVAKRQDKGVKQAGFLVLRETAMPSVLIEAGYLTNKQEEAYLAGEEGRAAVAESIFLAFKSYKRQMEEKVADVSIQQADKKTKTSPSKSTPAAKTAAGKKNETAPPAATAAASTNKPPSPKSTPTSTSEKNTTPTLPPNKTWQIHLLSWPGPLDRNSGKLALLSNVKEEKSGSEYRYFIGTFATREEADLMLSEIKNLGFKTAQIVSR